MAELRHEKYSESWGDFQLRRSVFLTSVYAVKLTWLWLWPDSDFAQVRVRVSVKVPDPTQSQSQSQVSLTFLKSEILTRFISEF